MALRPSSLSKVYPLGAWIGESRRTVFFDCTVGFLRPVMGRKLNRFWGLVFLVGSATSCVSGVILTDPGSGSGWKMMLASSVSRPEHRLSK
eukprot:scaffold651476_cov110-Attheya_sp.AAC.1